VQDGPGAPLVGALNETAARRLFGDGSPLGRHLTLGTQTVEIVGIVSDSIYEGRRAPVRPTLFDSALQRHGSGGQYLVVRSAVPLEQIEPALRSAVAAVHRDLPVPEVKTQIAQMQDSAIRERVFAQLLSLFGAFTLLLAAIGLYGVTAYSVRRRTSEIGVRMALGAERRNVVWMIQRQVVVLALAGLAAGIPLALMVAPMVESLLFGVAPRDPGVIALSSCAMLVTALGAGILPARRAASIDPLRALRAD
jgi:predicted lysophospholipase L1 biosynthesis ABC-type transport system permease subunit